MPEDYSKYGFEPKAQDYSKYGFEPKPTQEDVDKLGQSDLPGAAKEFGQGALNLVKGIGSGVTHSAVGLYDMYRQMGRTPTGADTTQGPVRIGTAPPNSVLNPSPLPQAPQVLQQAGHPPQGTMMGTVGRGAEQLGEFFLPGSATNDMVKLAEKAPGILRTPAEILANGAIKGAIRTGGEALGAGVTTAVQTDMDKEKIAQAALYSGITSGAFSTVGTLLQTIPPAFAYSKLYIPSRFDLHKRNEIYADGIENAINISKAGIDKARAVEELNRAGVQNIIDQNGHVAIDPNIVKAPVAKLLDWADKIGDKEMAKSINKTWKNFSERYGAIDAVPATPSTTIQVPGANPAASLTPAGMPRTISMPGTPAQPAKPMTMTLSEANDVKGALYGVLEDAYGRLGSNKKLAQKAVARGLKESIEDIAPEVKALNQNTQNAKILGDAIEKYVEANPDLLQGYHLAYFLAAGLGNYLPHASGYAAAAATIDALRNPRIRSALVLTAHGQGPVAAAARGAATLATRGGAAAIANPQVSQGFSPMPSGLDTSAYQVPNGTTNK
jgi:hypothetical protein